MVMKAPIRIWTPLTIISLQARCVKKLQANNGHHKARVNMEEHTSGSNVTHVVQTKIELIHRTQLDAAVGDENRIKRFLRVGIPNSGPVCANVHWNPGKQST